MDTLNLFNTCKYSEWPMGLSDKSAYRSQVQRLGLVHVWRCDLASLVLALALRTVRLVETS